MVTKFEQFKKLKCPNFINCPNFVTIFCHVLRMKIIFFDIPSYPLPIAVRNSLTKYFSKKNLRFCIFSTTKKLCKTEEKRRVPVFICLSPFKIQILSQLFFLCDLVKNKLNLHVFKSSFFEKSAQSDFQRTVVPDLERAETSKHFFIRNQLL